VARDRDNLEALRRLRPSGARAELSLLLDHLEGREGEAVADPYHGADEHFDATWRDVRAGAEALARKLAAMR
jgi:protein-tyrosine phosphatase